ncbi:hypothetical protein D3C80_1499200 [compost metagenome]
MKRMITTILVVALVIIVSQAFAFQTMPGAYDDVRISTRNILNSSLLFVAMGISFIAGVALMAFIWEVVEEQRKHKLHH